MSPLAWHRSISATISRISATKASGFRSSASFSAAAFRHCENHYLQDSYERYAGKISALRKHLAAKPMHTKLSYEEHKDLLDAFAGGDIDEVVPTLLKHIGRTKNTYEASVDDIAVADATSPTT